MAITLPDNHGESRVIMENHGESRIMTENHGKPRIITENQGKSPKITNTFWPQPARKWKQPGHSIRASAHTWTPAHIAAQVGIIQSDVSETTRANAAAAIQSLSFINDRLLDDYPAAVATLIDLLLTSSARLASHVGRLHCMGGGAQGLASENWTPTPSGGRPSQPQLLSSPLSHQRVLFFSRRLDGADIHLWWCKMGLEMSKNGQMRRRRTVPMYPPLKLQENVPET